MFKWQSLFITIITGLLLISSSASARFYSVDPVGFQESNSISFNRYGYANNNPYGFTDPNGEEPAKENGEDEYNDALASHTFGVDGISDFDRSAIASGNVHQASIEAQGFMRGIPDSQYAKEMNQQLGGAITVLSVIATKGKKGPVALSTPTVGGGATLGKLTSGEIARIQNAANRSKKNIGVVGSRVNPNKALHSNSDYDYVINAKHKTRNNLAKSLPGAKSVRNGLPSNQDIFKGGIDVTKPHVIFHPR